MWKVSNFYYVEGVAK